MRPVQAEPDNCPQLQDAKPRALTRAAGPLAHSRLLFWASDSESQTAPRVQGTYKLVPIPLILILEKS